ncbi:ATP-binding protein [Hylemonella gracilis]|nr:ATP-binding protein [Hylemonella gracilis]
MKVNVAPDMGMYNLLRVQGYDPAYAIAEFVDNAISAHLKEKTKTALKVEIKFYSTEYVDTAKAHSIEIIDNGPGIPGERLAEAMKPAKQPEHKGLSEFGIGMKAAAVWFADTWKLSTKPRSEAQEHSLTFDLTALLASGQQEVDVTSEVSKVNNHTTIRLLKPRRTIDREAFASICAELRDVYQRFTSGEIPRLELTAYFDGTPTNLRFDPTVIAPILDAPEFRSVGKQTYSIGKKRVWTVEIDTMFKGSRVTGTISLLEKGSYKSNPGLVIFRHERVICGTTNRPFVPANLFGTGNKYARQRVYGILFADDLPVTYTKDAFDFKESEFGEHLMTLPKVLELKTQAESYRTDSTKVIHFKTEAEFNRNVTNAAKPRPKPPAPSPAGGGGSGSGVGGGAAPRPTPAPPLPEPTEKVMTDLQASPHASTALRAVISEALLLYRTRREIALSMCLRAVLEAGMLLKIQRSFPKEYPKVADKGVVALINYMNTHTTDFFDAKNDFRLIKTINSIAGGQQKDVVLLNNASHAHYQPSLEEINRFVGNLENLLVWAYS